MRVGVNSQYTDINSAQTVLSFYTIAPPSIAVFDCDLHTHSRFFHVDPSVAAGYDPIGTRLTLAVAKQRGFAGIAVTNHDYFRPETLVGESCLPGIEISTTEGHLLVIGSDPPTRTRPGELSPTEAVDLAHNHDCVAIIAHPFRNSMLKESDAPFDAVEINGKHPEYRRQVEALAADRGLPIVGGSDAHFPFEVGRVGTRFESNRLTVENVVAAIRDGRVEPVFHEGPLLGRLRGIYNRIHRIKGHRPPSNHSSQQ